MTNCVTFYMDKPLLFAVKRIFQHSLYGNRTDFDYDFSVLELEEGVECSDYVSPICLPDNSATAATYDNKFVLTLKLFRFLYNVFHRFGQAYL